MDQVQWQPNDCYTFVSASSDRSIKFFDVRQPKEVKSQETKGSNINLAWRPDGQVFAVGNKDDKVTYITLFINYKVFFYDVRMDKEAKTPCIEFKWEVNELTWDKTG